MGYSFMKFPGGKEKAFTLSYDDGCKYDEMFSDIITSYGLKCTFNLTLITPRALSFELIKEKMLDRGHEVAVHGALHKAPGLVTPVESITDILECKKTLEEKYNRIIRGYAYPDSGIRKWTSTNTYEDVKVYLKDLGIAYARSLAGDNNEFNIPTDWYNWIPTAHHSNPLVLDYIDEFLNINKDKNCYTAMHYPKLFYLWGHSYEFNNNNNWDLLRTICEKVSHNDDIWYATNIEIYDYIEAYRSIIYSADRKIMYNPSLLDIWFSDGENEIKMIKSGETLYL